MNASRYRSLPRRLVSERRAVTNVVGTLALTLVVTAAEADAAGGGRSAADHVSVPAAEAMTPLTVIDRADIELSGVRNVYDLLFSRRSYNAFGLSRASPLGSGRSLFLIDGRPIPDPEVVYTLESLSISAIERVELLDGAAAAIHGVQAVDGAVNIVLRRGHEGFEAQASIESPADAGGDSRHASALWGGALGDGRLVIGTDFLRRREIRRADRDYSRASWAPGGPFATAVGVSKFGNTLYIPTSTTDENDVTTVHVPGVDRKTIASSLGECRGGAYTGALTNPGGVAGTGCGFAWADFAWSRSRFERKSLFVSFEHPFGEEAGLYADARGARGETLTLASPASDTVAFELSQNLWDELRPQLHPDTPQVDASNLPDELAVDHRFIGHGGRDLRQDIEDYDLTIGLQGRFSGDVDYDVHLRYFRDDIVLDGGGFVSRSAIVDAIEDGRYDLGNPLSQDPDHIRAVRESALRLNREVVETHRTARASFEGTGFALGGRSLRWTVGTELDHEKGRAFQQHVDATGRSRPPDDIIGFGGNSYRGERRRWSGFGAASLPVHHRWDIDVGMRRDQYDDVGSAFSRHLASRLRLHEAVTVRGAWTQGSDAPSLFLLNLPQARWYSSVCDTRNLTGALADCDPASVLLITGGNSNLVPDKAESASIGVALSLGPVDLWGDAFHTRVTDEPAIVPPQVLVDMDTAGRVLPPGAAVIRNLAGTIEQIENPILNSGERRVSGLDLRGRAHWEHDWADLTLDARWYRLNRFDVWTAGELDPCDCPRNRVHASLRVSRGNLVAQWSVHAVSGFRNVRNTGRFPGWTGHDIAFHWRDAFGLDGVDLGGGVVNVADRGPPVDSSNPGSASTTLDSTRGRTLFLSARFSLDP